MRRMKKKSKKQDENMITNLINSIDTEVIIRPLEFEESINQKKINNEKLTEAEYLFDTYFIKPSTLASFLLDFKKRRNK